jgi:hypothetical protein
VKSWLSSADGPTTRRALRNVSLVAYSTIIRAARSARAQTTAASSPTSVEATPSVTIGRTPGAVMMPGA